MVVLLGQGPNGATPTEGLKSTDCRYFLIGQCMKGDACPFRHSRSAKLTPACRRCQSWALTGTCSLGPSCPHRHPDPRDVIPCRFYSRPTGCMSGDACSYIHDDFNRPQQPPPQAVQHPSGFISFARAPVNARPPRSLREAASAMAAITGTTTTNRPASASRSFTGTAGQVLERYSATNAALRSASSSSASSGEPHIVLGRRVRGAVSRAAKAVNPTPQPATAHTAGQAEHVIDVHEEEDVGADADADHVDGGDVIVHSDSKRARVDSSMGTYATVQGGGVSDALQDASGGDYLHEPLLPICGQHEQYAHGDAALEHPVEPPIIPPPPQQQQHQQQQQHDAKDDEEGSGEYVDVGDDGGGGSNADLSGDVGNGGGDDGDGGLYYAQDAGEGFYEDGNGGGEGGYYDDDGGGGGGVLVGGGGYVVEEEDAGQHVYDDEGVDGDTYAPPHAE